MAGSGKPPDGIGRRRLIEDAARAVCGAGLAGGAVGLAATAGVKPAHALRPPGAREESAFLAACVKCGLCVRACPYGTLRLATLGDGVAIGSPYFVAREVPCEMCDTIPCVVACPTGALDPALKDINKADMGVASLVGRETCLNLQGLRCDVCYRVCPVIDKAITLEASHNTRTGRHAVFEPVVHAEHCTGCGKCEKSCVLEKTAIRVLPRELAEGRGGAHYQFGWREKDKAGAPLVPDVIRLPERLPEMKP